MRRGIYLCVVQLAHRTVRSPTAEMTRKPQKILYVGRRKGLAGDLLGVLKAAGYDVTVTRSSLASGPPDDSRAFDLVLCEGVHSAKVHLQGSRRPSKSGPAPMTLRSLRESVGKTQAEVARKTAMSQPQLSRVEARRDHLTSTLRKYVRALGGEVEIMARVGNRSVTLLDV